MTAHARRRLQTPGIVLTLALTLVLAACGAPPPPDPFRPAPRDDRGLSVSVHNGYHLDVRIYMVRGSVPIPLGTVGSAERRVFRISSAEVGHMGAIRLVADPLGSRRRFTSEIIQVAPGQRVEWRLAHALNLSSVTVR